MAQKIKEANLWAWLAKAREFYRERLDIQRVENSTSSGTPDVEGFLQDGLGFWIELKTAFRPKRSNTPIDHGLKPAQINWIHRRTQVGGRVFILIQVGSGSDAKIYMINGQHALEFQKPLTEGMLHALSIENEEAARYPQTIILAAGSKELSWD